MFRTMRDLRLVARLRLLFMLMLSVCLGSAALSVWSVRQTYVHLERMDLAHRAYEAHLALSNDTYQLFKQYGDALVIGDRDRGAGERALIASIRGDIAEIRTIIGAEIELVGEDEVDELQALAQIELKIEALIRAFDSVLNSGLQQAAPPDEFSADWRRLSHILDAEIDRDFREMIRAALDEEASEVAETRDVAERQLRLLQVLAGVSAVIALLAAFASFWTLNRRVKKPMERLVAGVRDFGEGDMARRVGMDGTDELAEIAAAFDMMAARVEENATRLVRQNTELEAAVADRTGQLEDMLAQARRAESDRRRMLSDVSHELRTPLTIIKGEAEVALRGGEKSLTDYRDALTRTRDAATHTARLVDDLLFVARSEEGHARLKARDIDLVELLRDTLETFGGGAEIENGADTAPLHGDPDRIGQAVMVLLENARHHGGDEVLVRLGATPGGWRIAVEDNGAGMSDEDKARAFERYYRGANAAGRYGSGVGLGLPVARAIAQAHKGTITLEDRPGSGLIAALTLPRKQRLEAVK